MHATTTSRQLLAGLAVGALAVAVLVLAPPDAAAWSAAWSAGRAAARESGPAPSVDALAVLFAGTALWALAAWVLLVVLAAQLTRAPGALGALGRLLVRVTVPRVLRGLVSGGVAGGMLLGPAAAAVAMPVAPSSPAAAVLSTPGPAWPTSPPAPTEPADPGTAPAPATPAPASPAPAPAWPTAPTMPTAPTTPSTPGTPTAPTTPGAVVVAPGDSLWSVAADALRRAGTTPTDAAVAAAWPDWYAANRGAVGPDPGLLHPGTTLVPPSRAGTSTDGSTS